MSAAILYTPNPITPKTTTTMQKMNGPFERIDKPLPETVMVESIWQENLTWLEDNMNHTASGLATYVYTAASTLKKKKKKKNDNNNKLKFWCCEFCFFWLHSGASFFPDTFYRRLQKANLALKHFHWEGGFR